MRKRNKPALVLMMSILISGLIACSTVPISGRRQVNLMPESEMLAMSLTSYGEFLENHTLSSNKYQSDLVKSVGGEIAGAVEDFFRSNNLESRIEGYDWEFNLIEEDVPNAWCMPGGKVVVYTGILPITQNPGGLAVVMGHEIAHAVARHGNERMSQAMLIQLGGMALDVALEQEPDKTRNLFMAAYGIGTNVGIALPYSRAHESEADKLGLIFMAMAGYNPNESITFWERMAATGGEKPPEFLSTHPGEETRIENLKAYLPEAMKYYRNR